ncbi:hypothetical protein GXW82_16995 [Streptacidiphilus sp. 4-A2]|nr:hypothetical protein [Streptacidiphilus sp. 4-A2]
MALLLDRLAALAAAPAEERAVRRAVQGVRLALYGALPPGHPVRSRLDGPRLTEPVREVSTVALRAGELHTWLTAPGPPTEPGPTPGPDPGPDPVPGTGTAGIVAAVRRRLLGERSLSPEEVRHRCGDSAAASIDGLIRLDDPVHGTRYPAFQFSTDGGGAFPVVRRVNALLQAETDPWARPTGG